MSETFDWALLEQPTTSAMVRGQLEFSWMVLAGRLAELTDDQYAWRPAPGALSVVRRHTQRGARVLGAGDWVAQLPEDPESHSVRTIGWLVAHLTEVFFERWEWTFGARRQGRDEITLHGSAREAVAWLTHWVDQWRTSVAALSEADMARVGLSQATQIDASAPFGHVALQVNRELIHHGAEIMVLQDLHAAGTV